MLKRNRLYVVTFYGALDRELLRVGIRAQGKYHALVIAARKLSQHERGQVQCWKIRSVEQ